MTGKAPPRNGRQCFVSKNATSVGGLIRANQAIMYDVVRAARARAPGASRPPSTRTDTSTAVFSAAAKVAECALTPARNA
jgi:hypothetical protein